MKGPKKAQVSVREETFNALRKYCRKHGVNMRSVVDDIINAGLDEADLRADREALWMAKHRKFAGAK